MPYLDSPVREHVTLEGALAAIFDKLDSLDGRLTDLDGISEKLDSLDAYARNHMTSKMDKGFGDVAERFDKVDTDLENIRNDVAIAKNLFQDHDH